MWTFECLMMARLVGERIENFWNETRMDFGLSGASRNRSWKGLTRIGVKGKNRWNVGELQAIGDQNQIG